MRRGDFQGGLDAADLLSGWFWRIVDAMPAVERAKLLAYVTGSPVVPATGEHLATSLKSHPIAEAARSAQVSPTSSVITAQ